MKWDSVEGYNAEAAETVTHGWYDAQSQIPLLKRQLLDLDDGGLVLLGVPSGPSRCPSAPYERASMIAHYLKHHKPASKLLILDAKPEFPKQALFQEGWEKHYGKLIEWVGPDTDGTGGGVQSVDAKTLAVTDKSGEKYAAQVINILPQQKAGNIAFKAGCALGDWCPILPDTFESSLVRDVYVLGDSAEADKMPKTAFAANSQAKVAANAIAAELAGKKKFPPRFRNTCWSLLATNDCVKAGASYRGR